MLPPAIVVHGLDEVRLVLRHRLAACLLSAADAGSAGGAPWWRAMVAAGLAETEPKPAATCDILDCGAAPGAAMAALRHGQRLLILDPACPAFPRVAGVAAGLGARVLPARPPALDLRRRHAILLVRDWLEQQR